MTDTVRDILSAGGAVERVLGSGYEPRDEQLRMADAVTRAMASKSHLAVEAGTGVGKSFAYLVPAIERATRHDEIVVVATNTIALQEQLVNKDIPLLQRALAEETGAEPTGQRTPLRPVLVKGRGNYVSLRRLKLASERQDRLLTDAASRRSLHVIEDWAYDTEDGTLATLPPLERPGVWDRAQSDSGNCMGRRCPTYEQCFYQNARREMERGNLLICNHALFFSDLSLRSQSDGAGFLPRYDQVILDEAHMIEDVAADHFGVSLTEGRVMHLLGMLYHERTHKGFLAHLRLNAGDDALAERAVHAVLDAAEASRAFFGQVTDLWDAGRLPGGRIRQPDCIENPLTDAMNALALSLRRLKEAAPNEPDRFELNAYAQRAAAIADHAETLITHALPGACYWVEVGAGDDDAGRRGRNRRVSIACSPTEVAPILKEHLFGGDFGVIMTSATLATRTASADEPAEHAETAFAHFATRTGCEGADTLQLGSPFDHARQMQVHVDATMPAPGAGSSGDESYPRAIVTRVLEHAEAVGGGVFCLFTSFRTLEACARMIADPLEALGYPLLVQGRGPGAGSRGALLEAFREAGDAVLFGAASFWQGVDVRGEALRCVVITRLPFEPPDRPLTEARVERIRARGGDPFREDALPRAAIRFKQGVGRLIRAADDRGRVVILDPRVVTKPYGSLFLRALPEGVEPVVER